MVLYRVFYSNPHRHFISFEGIWEVEAGLVCFQLPSWRPGRYELGNFAKNITNVQAWNGEGERLQIKKASKDLWTVDCMKAGKIRWTYDYYAAELNAGSTYLDDTQLYINPVNCFFYVEGKMEETYRIEFSLPENYLIASGMRSESDHVLLADSFDHLADCPLIASATLQHFEYVSHQIPFHVWIQGAIHIDISKLIGLFKDFTDEHFRIFSDIPCKDYHFLFQFPEIAVRHGVEHRNSTVIAMGPSAGLREEERFNELVGISCHELFHTWNVKNIRPVEMMPYNFTRENYSPSGFVYEGVTTYYGDLLLWSVGTFSNAQFFEILSETIETHLLNDGRFHLSLAQSSQETWLDGYVQGNPWRKVNIYNEGCLIALICDLRIIAQTHGAKSLDDVMVLMYERYGKLARGYQWQDYKVLLEEVSGVSFNDVFQNLVWGIADYMPYIEEALQLVDISIKKSPRKNIFSSVTGAKYIEANGKWQITDVMEDSPADRAGLWRGDLIQTIDGGSVLDFSFEGRNTAVITFLSQGIEKSKEINWTGPIWCPQISLESTGESKWFSIWKNRKRT